LANLVFCAAGTRVVECFNRSYVDGYFWRLAAVKKLDYRPIVPHSAEPLGSELSANRFDLDADIPQVLAALS
jgi:capsular polysaccharide biosynthesis protein